MRHLTNLPLPKSGAWEWGPSLPSPPPNCRPAEVETLSGDPAKAKTKLGWVPRITFDELVAEMVREDLKSAERDELFKKHGCKVMDYHE